LIIAFSKSVVCGLVVLILLRGQLSTNFVKDLNVVKKNWGRQNLQMNLLGCGV
jgi:hypothetical protein